MKNPLRMLAAALVLMFLVATVGAQGDVSTPKILREVTPEYTAEAEAAGIEGEVTLEAVVRADGTVSDVKVTTSLDTEYGLDQQAVKALEQWYFEPGRRDGKPVPVLLAIVMRFTLDDNRRRVHDPRTAVEHLKSTI